MRIGGWFIIAALCVVVLGGPALAQQAGTYTPTPQQLDQMSTERMQAIGPRNWGPPPPQSSIPQENLTQPQELLVCMSADPWKNVYASPSARSRVIGATLPEVAVKGREVDGFVPILFGPGRTGYVAANDVRPFQSKLKPGSTCTIVGLRPNGSAVFSIH
jgi:hypothetical protein